MQSGLSLAAAGGRTRAFAQRPRSRARRRAGGVSKSGPEGKSATLPRRGTRRFLSTFGSVIRLLACLASGREFWFLSGPGPACGVAGADEGIELLDEGGRDDYDAAVKACGFGGVAATLSDGYSGREPVSAALPGCNRSLAQQGSDEACVRQKLVPQFWIDLEGVGDAGELHGPQQGGGGPVPRGYVAIV